MRDLIKKILREEVVDVNDIQDELLTMPLVARQKLLDDLTDVVSVDEEYINMDEQISYKGIPEIKAKTTVGKILKWVKRYITDKATNFLINASMNEIKETIDLLKVMDPTDTTAVFKPKAMYLGGGIDFGMGIGSIKTVESVMEQAEDNDSYEQGIEKVGVAGDVARLISTLSNQ